MDVGIGSQDGTQDGGNQGGKGNGIAPIGQVGGRGQVFLGQEVEEDGDYGGGNEDVGRISNVVKDKIAFEFCIFHCFLPLKSRSTRSGRGLSSVNQR